MTFRAGNKVNLGRKRADVSARNRSVADVPSGTRGVYAIVCIDGRSYVGSSNDIAHRWRDHKTALRSGKHNNKALQEAWTRLGWPAFRIEVLEVVTAEFLSPFEQKWLDSTKLKFNVFVDADMRVARAKQGPPGLGKKYRLRKDAGKQRSKKT